MAPNRSRSNSTTYQYTNRTNSPQAHRQPSRQSQHVKTPSFNPRASPATQILQQRGASPSVATNAQVDLLMSPASRYKQNLKVLRRHDPSIGSIFDQFSHVCLYHHNGSKWEKKGFEGSMFLFEREERPQYGFFILNRMGVGDYIQYISPTDEMDPRGDYLIYRCKNEILGLWMLSTEAREPLNVAMLRLFTYVQKNQRYPDEYRYGPGRKPPPNPITFHRRTGSGSGEDSSSDVVHPPSMRNISTPNNKTVRPVASAPQLASMSELDLLFSKLAPGLNPTSSSPQPNPVTHTQSSTPQPNLSRPQSTDTRGLALLDTIFASVTPSPAPPPPNPIIATFPTPSVPPPHSQAQPNPAPAFPTPLTMPIFPSQSKQGPDYSMYTGPPPSTQFQNGLHGSGQSSGMKSNIEIHSPKPSNAALPQILTAEVLHELMGRPSAAHAGFIPSHLGKEVARPPSTASASASSAYSGRGRGGERAGYLADRGEEEDDTDENSPLDDYRAEMEMEQRRKPGSAASFLRPVLVGSGSSTSTITVGAGGAGASGGGSSMTGDATPRVRAGRGLEPEHLRDGLQQRLASEPMVTSTPPPDRLARESSSRKAQFQPQSQPQSRAGESKSEAPKPITFQAGADLWPHSTGSPVNDRSTTSPSSSSLDLSDAVVELDFSEIGVLGDLKALEAREKGQAKAKAKGKARGEKERDRHQIPAGANGAGANVVSHQESGKRNPGLKGSINTAVPVSAALDHDTPRTAHANINGKAKEPPKAKQQEGDGRVNLVQNAILQQLGQTNLVSNQKMEKKEFIREVLTLFHTDKSFVDQLYDGYLKLVN